MKYARARRYFCVKDYPANAIRNISLIGHGTSGKTTLVESMFHQMGALERLGRVDDGTSASDFLKEEIERKGSVSAALMTADHKGKKYNVFDTPGFSDFIGEVNGALRVSDSALVVVHGTSGVEVVTEQVWEICNENDVPRIIFINQLDKENTKFDAILDELESTFGNTVAISFPVDAGPGFSKIVNLLTMKVLAFKDGKVTSEELSGDLLEKAEGMREVLVERAAEADDDLMEKFFEAGELTPEEIELGLRKGIVENALFPVLCGAAYDGVGVSALVDFIGKYAPSPLDGPPQTVTNKNSGEESELVCDPAGPPVALVFKTTSEAHVGEMSYFRVYSGAFKSGDELLNVNEDNSEKLNQMYWSMGKQRNGIDHVTAGDIGIAVKLHDTFTGQTLATKANPLTLLPPEFPEPIIRAAVISKNSGDEDKISSGLTILQKADPTFNVVHDPELSQMILNGQGDAHLTVVLNRLKDRFGVETEMIKPRIPYRETIKSSGEAEGKHKKQSGGRGQFGLCVLKVTPAQRGEGYEFLDEIVGGSIPRQFIPAVDKGIRESLEKGVIAGYQVVDVKVHCIDGKFHAVDSDEFSFKIAGSIGFREAVKKTKTAILEPIYEVEIKCPQ
ncbi:MAG TPA: elongation factor G, partial [Bacteroidetes bacterium]|nr:elongation factor G [Bacteroidota bacterium]HEX05327.1 elongation factor G [Bacteroidota bacterium]